MQPKIKHILITIICTILAAFGAQNINAQTIVKDSSLELGPSNPYWMQQSTHFSKTICDGSCGNVPGVQPLSGNYFIWLGGSNILEEGSASQSVIIPTANYAKLSFHLKTPIVAANIDDFFHVLMDSTIVFNITSADSDTYKTEYKNVIIDISSFADGQSHLLKFFGHQTGTPRVTHYLVDDISIKLTVGFPDADSISEIKIYPNPTSDFIHLRMNRPQNIRVKIFTLEGKRVLQKSFSNASNINMDVSTLPKGFYFLIIEGKNHRKILKKLIVE